MTAVFSLARYTASFEGRKDTPDNEKLLLKRSCKVLAHESGHMFGMSHCIYYHCLMNGSNHLEESDARPLHFCPVCLRKLHHGIGFAPAERYRGLRGFYSRAQLGREADWLDRRIRELESAELRE